MSPELLGVVPSTPSPGGGGKYDARAVDVWAMGVMMYLLVTGVYPFEVSGMVMCSDYHFAQRH